ncbi:hypothetical protein [Posidoniimonas polymericola]|nr:hypothetical protein [Posidoniimonas polymericola]
MSASLEGEFAVTYPETGGPFISSFEVVIARSVTEGPVAGGAEGSPLSDYLYHDPVGLTFGRTASALPFESCDSGLCIDTPPFNACDPWDWNQDGVPTLSLYPPLGTGFDDRLQTEIWVEPIVGGAGAFQLRSNGRGLILDGLNATTVAGGLPVRVVPTPDALSLACLVLLAPLGVSSGRRRFG